MATVVGPTRNRRRMMANFFAAFGFGPYECFFCRKSIPFGDDFLIHHINEDEVCDVYLNLAAAHRPCHARWHRLTGAPLTHSPESRALMSQQRIGRTHSPETREKMRAAQATRRERERATA